MNADASENEVNNGSFSTFSYIEIKISVLYSFCSFLLLFVPILGIIGFRFKLTGYLLSHLHRPKLIDNGKERSNA